MVTDELKELKIKMKINESEQSERNEGLFLNHHPKKELLQFVIFLLDVEKKLLFMVIKINSNLIRMLKMI